MTEDQPTQLPPQYAPGEVETRRYDEWAAKGLFGADAGAPAPAYSIVIPPPNVTGSLHMGHALDHTFMDALIRRRDHDGVRRCGCVRIRGEQALGHPLVVAPRLHLARRVLRRKLGSLVFGHVR